MKRFLILVTIVLMSCATTSTTPVDHEQATILSTVNSLYDVISGPAGPRDWNHFRSLFADGAHMTAIRKTGAASMTLYDYASRSGAYMLQNGFFEHAIANRVERYGNIAQVFSTYESRHNANDAIPFARGINSFQLVRDNGAWKIASIIWQPEDAQMPIPQDYLPKSR